MKQSQLLIAIIAVVCLLVVGCKTSHLHDVEDLSCTPMPDSLMPEVETSVVATPVAPTAPNVRTQKETKALINEDYCDDNYGMALIGLALQREAQIPRKETSVYGVSLSAISCERVAASGGIAVGIGLNDYSEFHGLQVAGVFNKTKSIRGCQVSPGMNYGVFQGLQIAGVFNADFSLFDKSISHGLQCALGLNFALELTGAQMAIVANDAGILCGLQIALLNHAGELHGLQLGLFNRADSGKGVQLGLVNAFGEDNDVTWTPIFNARF